MQPARCPTVVDRLRAKRTLYVAWSANAVFAVASAFPRWETLVPASAFVGVTMASGNIVYGLYVTGLADQLDPANGQSLTFVCTTQGNKVVRDASVFCGDRVVPL